MKYIREKLRVPQNLGWMDRVIRILVGSVMLLYPVYLVLITESTQAQWPFYSMLLSIYPWLTGIVGYDPIYKLFSFRTCNTSGTNPCGTFPYEVDAALGNKPIPKSDIEHSLEQSRH